jgi:hypothetical protein
LANPPASTPLLKIEGVVAEGVEVGALGVAGLVVWAGLMLPKIKLAFGVVVGVWPKSEVVAGLLAALLERAEGWNPVKSELAAVVGAAGEAVVGGTNLGKGRPAEATLVVSVSLLPKMDAGVGVGLVDASFSSSLTLGLATAGTGAGTGAGAVPGLAWPHTLHFVSPASPCK